MLELGGLVVLDPVDGPVPPRLVWARVRPPDRRKIAIVAHRRFIVSLRLRGHRARLMLEYVCPEGVDEASVSRRH
jgi:hypothetical protein